MVDERERWISQHAAKLRRVLADPRVCAEILALLGGDDQEPRRQRRLAELATELSEQEVTWKLGDHDGP
jgi:hypothetical protein